MSDLLMKIFQMRSGRGFSSFALFVAMLIPMNAALAEDFMVQYDQSRLLRLARPANTIIVGNPSIADVSIQGKKLLVVTGKSFGVTNLIVLDESGAVIINRKMVVRGDERKFVSLQKGVHRRTFNCFPTCQPALIVGDQSAFTEAIAKGIKKKSAISAEQGSGPGR